MNRRSFIKNGAIAAGAATVGAGLLSHGLAAFAQEPSAGGNLTKGDIAILRFLAAAELIESDLWQQYAELGGVTQGTQNNYQPALQYLDGDGSQYITSNTLDEVSHAAFLNAYLVSKGADPVDLDQFRTLQGSKAGPAANVGRLTNLMNLNVDTSWYIRYRSATNPDFGASYPQAIKIVNRQVSAPDALLPDLLHTQLVYFYSAPVVWFYSALDRDLLFRRNRYVRLGYRFLLLRLLRIAVLLFTIFLIRHLLLLVLVFAVAGELLRSC
ncbi:MAG: twin-arginine translocation signal domain-containing protein [Candidatus Korobacteraceae bacterium]